jgi:hypothetical protein
VDSVARVTQISWSPYPTCYIWMYLVKYLSGSHKEHLFKTMRLQMMILCVCVCVCVRARAHVRVLLGLEFRALTLARPALYCLSHISSTFCLFFR